MDWFGVFSITWVFASMIFFGAGMYLLILWLKHIAEFRPAEKFSELFDIVKPFAKKNVMLIIIASAGGGLAMTSVFIGDTIANQPCIETCRDKEWKNGRLRRGNPHKAGEISSNAECWCYSGKEWSDTSITIKTQK